MRAEKKGIPLSGNEIYKQLEAKVKLRIFPRCGHTVLIFEHRTIGIHFSHGGIVGLNMSLFVLDLNWPTKKTKKMKTRYQFIINPK